MNWIYFLIVLLFFSTSLFCEIKITPVVQSSLLGGQYFFENESTSFGGNVNIFASPVINFSPRTALLPMVTLTYRGTKDVQELVGGGTLTQEYIDIGPFTLKFVHKFSDTVKIKAKAGYKIEYLKETKDEDWQKGLFDYNKITFGLESEKTFPDLFLTIRTGIDYYTMRYPNYKSLISEEEYETSLDTTTYKEISENAGEDVLDYNAGEVLIEGTYGVSENVSVGVLYNIVMKNFVDQHIVEETGKFKSDLRNDNSHLIGFSLFCNFERAMLSLSESVKLYNSNQNSYDTAFTKFTPDFYNYIENSFSPSVVFYIGQQPYMKLNLFLDISYRKYLERLAQNSSGNYTSDKIWQTTNTAGINFSYPLANILKGLSAKLSTNYSSVSSNMKYEKFYRYNYTVFNYFLGVEWEY